MPFSFVENRGQASQSVRFIGNGPQFSAWFEDHSMTLQQGSARVRVQFIGGAASPVIHAVNPTGALANYMHGTDRAKWQTGLPLFNEIRYEEIWPEISTAFRAEATKVKTEYRVAAGASVDLIRLRFEGEARIQSDGSLVVDTPTGRFHEDKPYLYQDTATGRREVRGGFRISPDGVVGYQAEYDHTLPLVIDPPILFSGYFGGSGQNTITAVAVNSSYNIIVAGWTTSGDLPASGGARTSPGGGVDAFVANFSPVGGQLVACTYLGGVSDDRAFGLALDSSDNIYITGQTSSSNFPVLSAVQTKLGGSRDAFVAKLNPTASTLLFSTYFGGVGTDVGNAIAIDAANNPVITGDTTSSTLPTTVGAFRRTYSGVQDAFVLRLASNGTSIGLLTYFGGSSSEHAAAIKIIPSGAIVIGGSTYSANMPVLLPLQASLSGVQDAFIAELNPAGSALIISTYLGGTGGTAIYPECVTGLANGPAGNIYAVGVTGSTDFPITSGVVQSVYGGGQSDGFIVRIQATTGALQISTFVGGSLNDGLNAVTLDANKKVYVTGFTTSTDFPVRQANQAAPQEGIDAVVMTFDYGLTMAVFSTYLGGTGNDTGVAIAVDSLTNIVVAGQTGSANFPVKGSMAAHQTSVLTSFVTKLSANYNLAIRLTPDSPTLYMDTWHITGRNGSTQVLSPKTYGNSGDLTVMGDWTNTGVTRIGVFRNGLWILDTNNNYIKDAGDPTISFGQAGDIPVVGDWNGSGTLKLGLFRNGTFILDLSGHLSGVPTGVPDAVFTFGQGGDIPVAGDWNGSGTTKVGIFRNGLWLLDFNGDRVYNNLDKSYTYGQAGDIPLVGDWDSSNSATQIGVFRTGTWILDRQGDGILATELTFTFGGGNMQPVSWK